MSNETPLRQRQLKSLADFLRENWSNEGIAKLLVMDDRQRSERLARIAVACALVDELLDPPAGTLRQANSAFVAKG